MKAIGLLAWAVIFIYEGAEAVSAQPETYRGLICRGVEEAGWAYIGQPGPGLGAHLVSLFVTGPNPLAPRETAAEHVAWASDPLHSYVADGTGALVVWAHPAPRDLPAIMALPGLTGLEINYAGDALSRDALWDAVLQQCVAAGRPFLWAFAADDTHSRTQINLSWYAARVPCKDCFALKAALRAGAFYVSNGPLIEDIQVQGRAIKLRLGQASEVAWLSAGQHLSGQPTETLIVTTAPGENHCLQWDRGVWEATLALDRLGLVPAQLKFVRAIVRTSPTRIAQTQPWRLREDGSLDNPYPPTGLWLRGQTHNHTDAGPGNVTAIRDYRLAYQAQGQEGSFSTDYCYWETPYQWLPEDDTPYVEAITPDRVRAGEATEALIRGCNLRADTRIQLGARPVDVQGYDERGLRVRLPVDLPPGLYDVVATNPDGFRGCLPLGFVVQEPTAQNDGWETFTPTEGLPYPVALCVACVGGEEETEQIWIGSVAGASLFAGGRWQKFRAELAGGSAYAILPDPNGGLWLAGAAGLAYRDPHGQWTRHIVGNAEGLPSGRAMERWGRMTFDPAGRLWITNRWSAGLGLRENGQWRRLTRERDGLPSNSCTAIACDGAGRLWAGFSGLYRCEAEGWKRIPLPAPLANCSLVTALKTASDGSIWAAVCSSRGSESGLVHFRGDEAEIVLPGENTFPRGVIRDILLTRRGELWLASDFGVARRTNEGRWLRYTALNSGLVCDLVLGLAEDRQGRIWLATARGVNCFQPPA